MKQCEAASFYCCSITVAVLVCFQVLRLWMFAVFVDLLDPGCRTLSQPQLSPRTTAVLSEPKLVAVCCEVPLFRYALRPIDK